MVHSLWCLRCGVRSLLWCGTHGHRVAVIRMDPSFHHVGYARSQIVHWGLAAAAAGCQWVALEGAPCRSAWTRRNLMSCLRSCFKKHDYRWIRPAGRQVCHPASQELISTVTSTCTQLSAKHECTLHVHCYDAHPQLH
jgi:hypothetical protein